MTRSICLNCLEVSGPVLLPCRHCGWRVPGEWFRIACAYTDGMIPFERFDAIRAEMKAARDAGRTFTLTRRHLMPEPLDGAD